MERHLNLIKSESNETEKKRFPRFPFSYLTFKGDDDKGPIFEVKELSLTGAQLALKDGGHEYLENSVINGHLHWRGEELKVCGTVKWITGTRLGIAFNLSNGLDKELLSFLSVENVIKNLRPLHNTDLTMEIPSDLKYWLRSDGPVEIFIWCHNDGELSHFELIFWDSFVEWSDGKGVRTGRVLTKRDLDTPLITEDEFVFKIDDSVDSQKLDFAEKLVHELTTDHLPVEAQQFLIRKIHY